jgi:hypothetical protein
MKPRIHLKKTENSKTMKHLYNIFQIGSRFLTCEDLFSLNIRKFPANCGVIAQSSNYLGL